MFVFSDMPWREIFCRFSLGRGGWPAVFVGGLIAFCIAGPAAAQTAFEDSVAQRPRPDHDPDGIFVGGPGAFILLPTFEVATEYTDNLFRTKGNTESDFAFVAKPTFTLTSDWDNHEVKLAGHIETFTYLDNPDEDTVDYNVAAAGRLDTGDISEIGGIVSFGRDHEDRGSPDDTGFKEPTIVHSGSATVGGVYRGDVISLLMKFSARRIDVRDNGTVNNDDRDRNEYKIRTRASYEWVPGSAAFIEGSFNIRDYDDTVDDDGFRRSSQGFEVLFGNTLDLSGVTFTEVAIGYHRQDYDKQIGNGTTLQPTLNRVEGLSFLGRVVWNPTYLLSLTGKAGHSIEETTVEDASAASTSSFGVKIDYEATPDVLLDTGIEFRIEDFEGSGRIDDSYEIGAGAKYLIGQHFVAEARYTFETRDSDAAGEGYDASNLRLSLKLQF